MTTKKNVKPATKAPAKPMPGKREKGFWNITAGTRKEEIAKVLDNKGKSAAIDQGNALGLSKATVISWIQSWIKSGLVNADKDVAAKSKTTTTKSDRKSKEKQSATKPVPETKPDEAAA